VQFPFEQPIGRIFSTAEPKRPFFISFFSLALLFVGSAQRRFESDHRYKVQAEEVLRGERLFELLRTLIDRADLENN
jgi:hypothetical protein